MALLPRPQQSHDDFSAYMCQERQLPMPVDGLPWMYKSTFGPHETLLQWESVQDITYKIAFFRDPVSTLASAADERWRGTCGGFYEKMMAADVMARVAYTEQYYDAVIFAENVYPSPEATMREIGAIPDDHEARGITRRVNATAKANTTAIRRTQYPAQHSERKTCILMPFLCTLYGYGYDPRYGRMQTKDRVPKSFSWRSGNPEGVGCGDRGCGLEPRERSFDAAGRRGAWPSAPVRARARRRRL